MPTRGLGLLWGTKYMDSSNALAKPPEEEVPAAILRGTARGLEIVIEAKRSIASIASEVLERLDEAPAFFKGSDVRVRVVDGPLPTGCLARLDEIAEMFELRIVEVTASAVPEPNLATGSAPQAIEEPPAEPVVVELEVVAPEPAPVVVAPPPAIVPPPIVTPGTRVFVGPVRSGVILDHVGHLFVFGDVNPGAEVRATGNIIVLGRLRGTAHAGIGQDVGFILALRLEPQQLRIGRQVARASDSDKPASEPELAYGTGGGIIVERYAGKLPRNLVTSI